MEKNEHGTFMEYCLRTKPEIIDLGRNIAFKNLLGVAEANVSDKIKEDSVDTQYFAALRILSHHVASIAIAEQEKGRVKEEDLFKWILEDLKDDYEDMILNCKTIKY